MSKEVSGECFHFAVSQFDYCVVCHMASWTLKIMPSFNPTDKGKCRVWNYIVLKLGVSGYKRNTRRSQVCTQWLTQCQVLWCTAIVPWDTGQSAQFEGTGQSTLCVGVSKWMVCVSLCVLLEKRNLKQNCTKARQFFSYAALTESYMLFWGNYRAYWPHMKNDLGEWLDANVLK